MEIGLLYGYFPNGFKTHLLAKLHHVKAAREMFEGTGIVVSTEGERYTWVEQLVPPPLYVSMLKEEWNVG